jgi:hypothetical protein
MHRWESRSDAFDADQTRQIFRDCPDHGWELMRTAGKKKVSVAIGKYCVSGLLWSATWIRK